MLHYSIWDTWGFGICLDKASEKALYGELTSYFDGKIRASVTECMCLPPVTIDTCKTVSNLPDAKALPHYEDHEILMTKNGLLVNLLIDQNLDVTFDHKRGLQIKATEHALNDPFLKGYILRTIRSYVDKIMMDEWFQLFHLWAVEINGTTILIAWDKGAGKTTSVIMALEKLGANYVANDRVWWYPEKQGLRVIEREAETKIWKETIQNSEVLRKQENPEEDPISWKFFFNRVYRFFGKDRRTISGVSDRILLPFIKSENNGETEQCPPDSVLSDSVIHDCQWFNLHRALFGDPEFQTYPRIERILKAVVKWHWPDGILEWLKFLTK